MRRVFLTGVSGLLGTNIAHELLEAGYEVTGLLRKKAAYRGRQHPALRLIEGDLFKDLSSVLRNTDAVIHAAAETRQNLLHYSDYSKINFNATVMLYLAAVQCGVKRFVYISTANTIGHGNAARPGNEEMEPRQPFTSSFYARSKTEAERYLLEQKGCPEVVVLNPTFMLGAYGTSAGSSRLLLMGLNKRLLFVPPGGKNIVHVRDVAQAACVALTSNTAGERILIAGENLTYTGFFRRLFKITGQKTRLFIIPHVMLHLAGFAGDLLRWMGLRTGLSVNNTKILCENNFYSAEKSGKMLNMSYRSTEEAIKDTLWWFSQNNNNQKRQKQRNSISLPILLLALFCSFSATNHPGTGTNSGYTFIRKEKNISLSCRSIRASAEQTTRELRADFPVKARPEAVISVLSNNSLSKQWMKGVSEVRTLAKVNNEEWLTYIKYDIPWPLSNQDCIIRYRISRAEDRKSYLLMMTGEPASIPVRPGIERITHLCGSWKISDNGKGGSLVEYCIYSLQEPKFPRWATDPIIQQNLISTMASLREQVEKQP